MAERGVGLLSGWLAAWLVSSLLSRCPYRQCRLDPACWPALLLIMAQQPGRSTLCRCVRVYTGVAIHTLTMPDGAGAENCLTVGSDCDYPVDGRRAELLPRRRRSWERRYFIPTSSLHVLVSSYSTYLCLQVHSLSTRGKEVTLLQVGELGFAGWGLPTVSARTRCSGPPRLLEVTEHLVRQSTREGANESASSQPLARSVMLYRKLGVD